MAAVFIIVTLLAAVDLVEVIPLFAPVVASPWFPFLHNVHDLLALMVALYAAHKLSPAVGLTAVALFLVVHIPYALIVFHEKLTELIRLAVLTIAALFGVIIITVRRRLEAQLNMLAADLETQRAAEHRRVGELAVLNRVATAGVEENTIDGVIERAIQIIGDTYYPADYFGIGLVDKAAGALSFWRSTLSMHEERMKIPLGQGVAGQVVSTGRPWRVPDVGSEPAYRAVYPDTRSELCVPLKVEQSVIGIINVESTRLDAFSKDDERLLVTCAGQLATAIEKARLYDKAERRAGHLLTLRQASRALTSDLNLEDVMQKLTETARHLVNTSYGALAVLGVDGQLAAFHTAGMSEAERQMIGEQPRGRGLLGAVLHGAVPIRVSDLRRDPRSIGYPEHHPAMKAFMGVPIIARGKVLGGLFLTDKVNEQPFTREDEDLVLGLAADAAIAIENARLFGQVQKLSITDGLTAVYNRRHFFELAEREFERSRRYDRLLSAIMVDIDNFKNVNDEFGHAAGDEVLRVIAGRLLDSMREIDILGRYGGEEFAVLLPENDSASAQNVAERLRRRIEDAPISLEYSPLTVTISLGIATLDKGCESLAALLDRADQALYTAKQEGRNRVCVWQ